MAVPVRNLPRWIQARAGAGDHSTWHGRHAREGGAWAESQFWLVPWTVHYTVVTIIAMNISPRFEWDEKKNAANRRKHGISFEEAKTAFLDDNARLISDPEHSDDEERFVLLGLSISLRVLVVCHCYRRSGKVIRIISARKADRDEIEQYHWWLR